MSSHPLLHSFGRRLGLVTAAVCLAATPALAIDPDETISDITADASATTCADATCDVMFDLPNNTLQVRTRAGSDEATGASASISADVTVSAENEDDPALTVSTISLTVEAAGALAADGLTSSASYRIDVRVTDTDGGAVVAAQKVAEGVLDVDGEDIDVSELVVLSAALRRGHTYRVALIVTVDADADELGSASADLLFNDGFARWVNLTVAAGSDAFGLIAALQDQVDVLEGVVDLLEGQVDLLEAEIDALRADFENHTHDYRTGRGNGHNNEVATTTTPDDGPEVQPVVDQPGNSENSNGVPGTGSDAPGDSGSSGGFTSGSSRGFGSWLYRLWY